MDGIPLFLKRYDPLFNAKTEKVVLEPLLVRLPRLFISRLRQVPTFMFWIMKVSSPVATVVMHMATYWLLVHYLLREKVYI